MHALALLTAAAALAAAGLAGAASPIRVLAVADGDTLTVASGARVRLLQIDTPELGSGECYSRQARSALLRLAPPGSPVRLEADPALDTVDGYGRLLRYVWLGRLNVNLELVRQGAATPYFYRGARGKYAAAFLAAARQAKASRRGLWAACPGTRLDPFAPAATGVSGPPAAAPPASGRCDPNYAGGCVPRYPPDVDCADLRALGIGPVRVVGDDVHRLDGDGDGLGCEPW